MRIDYKYLENVLEIFLNSDKPTLYWIDFKKLFDENNHKFIFHIEIMADKKLIINRFDNENIGIKQSGHDYIISPFAWRLSADGHDFASAITKPSVLTTVMEKLQNEGLSAVIDISKNNRIETVRKINR